VGGIKAAENKTEFAKQKKKKIIRQRQERKTTLIQIQSKLNVQSLPNIKE
jgi:hypothetical protein